MSGARPRFDEVFVRCVPIFASCGMRFVDLPHSPASLARFFGDATWFCGVVAKCRERNEGGGGQGGWSIAFCRLSVSPSLLAVQSISLHLSLAWLLWSLFVFFFRSFFCGRGWGGVLLPFDRLLGVSRRFQSPAGGPQMLRLPKLALPLGAPSRVL